MKNNMLITFALLLMQNGNLFSQKVVQDSLNPDLYKSVDRTSKILEQHSLDSNVYMVVDIINMSLTYEIIKYQSLLNPEISNEKKEQIKNMRGISVPSYFKILSPELGKKVDLSGAYFDFEIREWPLKNPYKNFYQVTKKNDNLLCFNWEVGYDTIDISGILGSKYFENKTNKYLVYYNPDSPIGSDYPQTYAFLSGDIFIADKNAGRERFNVLVNYHAYEFMLLRTSMLFGIKDFRKYIPGYANTEYGKKHLAHLDADTYRAKGYEGMYWRYEAYSEMFETKVLLRLPKQSFWHYFELVYYEQIESKEEPNVYHPYEIKYTRPLHPESLEELKPTIRRMSKEEVKNNPDYFMFCKNPVIVLPEDDEEEEE